MRAARVSLVCHVHVLCVCFLCVSHASCVTVFYRCFTCVCPHAHAFALGVACMSCASSLTLAIHKATSHVFAWPFTHFLDISHTFAWCFTCVCFMCCLHVPLMLFMYASCVVCVYFSCHSCALCVSYAYTSPVTHVCVIPCHWPVLYMYVYAALFLVVVFNMLPYQCCHQMWFVQCILFTFCLGTGNYVSSTSDSSHACLCGACKLNIVCIYVLYKRMSFVHILLHDMCMRVPRARDHVT